MFAKMGDNYPVNAMEKQVIPHQSYLFDDLIIEEILTRLPVKSILRFKSVSKQWYSTLSSSDFAKAHLMKSPFSSPSAPVNTLLIESGHKYCLFSYDDDNDDIKSGNFEDNLVKLDIGFDARKNLHLTGCCNGLVCLTVSPAVGFILWNPATRKLHKYGSEGILDNFNTALYVLVASGFGYASSADDYKYVRIFTGIWGHENSSSIVHIFSLRENKWRKFDFDHDVIFAYGRAMLVKEKLYWTARSGPSVHSGMLLVSFDLAVERFDVIKFNLDHVYKFNLGVMGGCLSKCNFDYELTSDKLMHILKPPEIVKSIGVPKELRLDIRSEMIGFTRTGKFFATRAGKFFETVPLNDEERDLQSNMLGIVDTCTNQYTALLRFNQVIKISSYFPSLVSPFPVEEPAEA